MIGGPQIDIARGAVSCDHPLAARPGIYPSDPQRRDQTNFHEISQDRFFTNFCKTDIFFESDLEVKTEFARLRDSHDFQSSETAMMARQILWYVMAKDLSQNYLEGRSFR